jgi:uncharacterized protein (TIGR02284 family)
MTHPHDARLIGTLNGLIEMLKDGEEGFRTAADAIKDPQLKELFQRYSDQRRRFAEELRREVGKLGGEAERSGTLAGAAHRGWINIKAAATGGQDDPIIAECERGEDAAKKAYEEALEARLSGDLHTLISRQYAEVKAAHDRIRELERMHSG